MTAFSSTSSVVAESGMSSEMEMPWSGEMPQVTVGSMSSALILTMSSNSASVSDAKDFQRATASSHSAPVGE